MNGESKFRQAIPPILAALTLVLLLGACGAENPTGKTVTTVLATSPTATAVGMNNCTSCHGTETGEWKLGRHANMDDGSLDGSGNPSLAFLDSQTSTINCLDCHDALDDGRTRLVNGYTGNTPRPVVGCESCHGGGSEHNGIAPMARTGVAASGTGTSLQSSEFNTCTSVCHLTYGNDAFTVATHLDRTMRKHAAVPGDTRFNTGKTAANVPTGENIYYVNKADEQACTACHNPHTNTTVINKQYSRSKHGTPTDLPWIYYNWTYINLSSTSNDRSPCQRCHTSTGFRNYANSPATYNAGSNDFSYLQGVSAPTSNGTATTLKVQTETIYCWGCHTDYKGTLRDPGAITADYGYTSGTNTYAVATYTYPDVSGSNVCMACHTGRQNGDSIKNLNSAGNAVFDFTNQSFINSHYLTAGGTIFTATGYEFTSRLYDSPMLYMHSKIGTPGAPGTGTNGPCVGCHLSFTPEKHLFLPVTKLTPTDDTVVEVTSTVCETCHTGGDALTMSPEMLEEQKGLLREAVEALTYQLDRRGYYFQEAYPYFYKLRSVGSATVVSPPSTTVTYSATFTSGTITAGSTPDYFKFDNDGTYYKISSIVSSGATGTATLGSTYTGAATSGAYTIIRSGSSAAVKSWLTTTTPFYPSETVDTDTTGAVTGKNNMGAAFNFNLLEHDPGAFAHNRFYAKRLIYDSIDWLDDNNMNYSVGTTLQTICAAASAPAWCEGAETYLLINGIIPSSSAERP